MMGRFLIGASMLLCGVLASITYEQAQRWQSDRSLWCHAVTVAPEKPRTLNNCAGALMRAGASDRALPMLEHAAVMVEDPTRPNSRRVRLRHTIAVNRAMALVALHRPAEAKQVFAHVDPAFPAVARLAWLRE